MNLNNFKPTNETEDLLVSITKTCETLIEQTLSKAQETLKFKLTQPVTPSFSDPQSQLKGFICFD